MVKNIVILHGWASHLGNWQPFVNKLQKKGYKVYLPNLPTDKPMNTDEYSSWLKTYTKKLTKFILIGHSFGGQIAINHAARFPKKVVKLVLINSAGIRKKISLKRFIFLLLAKIGKLIFKLPLLSKYTSVAQKLLYKSAREQDYLKASTVLKKTLTMEQ